MDSALIGGRSPSLVHALNATLPICFRVNVPYCYMPNLLPCCLGPHDLDMVPSPYKVPLMHQLTALHGLPLHTPRPSGIT